MAILIHIQSDWATISIGRRIRGAGWMQIPALLKWGTGGGGMGGHPLARTNTTVFFITHTSTYCILKRLQNLCMQYIKPYRTAVKKLLNLSV